MTAPVHVAGDPGGRPAAPTGRARPRGRARITDILDEALAGVAARPARLVLTVLGTMLGVAALVGTLGLGRTAAGQVAERFDLASATRVAVQPGEGNDPSSADGAGRVLAELPWDAPERVRRLNGVAGVGTISQVGTSDQAVRTVPIREVTGATKTEPTPLAAVSPGLFEAVRAELATGRFFDSGHDERGDPVVLLGRFAAERLGINRVDAQPTIFVDDRPYTVIGIVESVSSGAELLDSVILPNGTARADFDLTSPERVEIRTELGAAQLIARQAAIAIDPTRPNALQVEAPPEQSGVRRDVEADVDALFLILGAVALLAGGLGIANVTLLSVLERVPEIGLRRALGASRREIATQFLTESVILGTFGGLLGATAGVLVTVGVSAFRDWTPLLDPPVAVGGPLLGAVIGLLAGTYPAWKAAAIEPITALRGA